MYFEQVIIVLLQNTNNLGILTVLCVLLLTCIASLTCELFW